MIYLEKNSPTIKGISSGFGMINDEQSFFQKNLESPNNGLFIDGKNSSSNSISNNQQKKQKKQSLNLRNNQIILNSALGQSNSGFMSLGSGKGSPESFQRGQNQNKLPNELSSIYFQSQLSRSKQSLKNKEQSKRSVYNQTQDEYYDSEEESDSEYYDDEESHSKIGPDNFSKYRITEVKSQSMNDYSVDNSVQGHSIEQLPFQNSISFSPNQSKNLSKRNNFAETSQRQQNQKITDSKQESFRSPEQVKKQQLSSSNMKYFKNQEHYSNKKNYVSELDVQFQLLQQKTEVIRVQNGSMKKIRLSKNQNLSKRSENTKDNLIQARKFKNSFNEAMTPKSVSHGLSNALQFQLKNNNKQQSETNTLIKNLAIIQKEESKGEDMKHNLIVENSISISKNYSSTGGTPFSKYTARDQIPQNQQTSNFINNNSSIQNKLIDQKITDPLARQTNLVQFDRKSTSSQDNFGKLCDRVAQQNITNPNDSQDYARIGTETTNIIQQQYLLGFETNSEVGQREPKRLFQVSGEINMSQNIQKNNISGGTLTSKTAFIFMENRVDETTNRKQINFSEAESFQLKQRQTTLKRTKRDKMFISSNEKNGFRKSIQVDSKANSLFSGEKKEIPKNQLLSPLSLQSMIKKQKKSQLFQQARKQELLDNFSNDANDLLKPGNNLHKTDSKTPGNDEQLSPSHSMSSHFSNASSTFLSKYTELTSSCVSQKKGGKKQINQYIITAQIGQGSFSKVKSVINCETKQVFAMKIINKAKLKKKILSVNQQNQFQQIEKEVAIMKKMGHPHIVKLIEIIDDPNHHKQYLICEYVPKGDLLQRINRLQSSGLSYIDESQARKYFRQLCSAVWYCHEVVQIFHRDIKPDNILLDDDDNIKLTDFGVSHSFEDKKRKRNQGNSKEEDFLQNNAGSDSYFSPEAAAGEKYSGKSADIWACAVTLYQISFGKLPFNASNRIELYEQISIQHPSFNQSEIKLTDCIMQNQLIDLISCMLNKQSTNRLTLDQIEKHPWVTANGTLPCSFKNDVSYVEFGLDPTQDDLENAVTQVEQIKNVKFKRI